MKKIALALAFAAGFAAAHAQVLGADHDYVVEDTGTYQDEVSSQYFNFGLAGGKYKSFGVLDFDASALGNVSAVTSAELSLTESDYASSKPVELTFWAVTDNTTSLAKGQTGVEYDDNVLGGYDGQLGSATELGTFAFQGATNGQVDTIDFTSGLDALANLVDSSAGVVRILITTDETGYATFLGASALNQSGYPTLTMRVQSTPEPTSLAALGIGAAVVLGRKRRR